MKIMMTQDADVKQSGTIKLTLPRDWIGDVPESEAKRLVKAGSAILIGEPVDPPPPDQTSQTLTPEPTPVPTPEPTPAPAPENKAKAKK
mgnify:FL=1